MPNGIHSTGLPKMLFDQFKESEGMRMTDCQNGIRAKFCNGELVWREDYPRTALMVYLRGYMPDRNPDMVIRAPAVAALWITYELYTMHVNVKLQQLRAAAEQLFPQCVDYGKEFPEPQSDQ